MTSISGFVTRVAAQAAPVLRLAGGGIQGPGLKGITHHILCPCTQNWEILYVENRSLAGYHSLASLRQLLIFRKSIIQFRRGIFSQQVSDSRRVTDSRRYKQ
jgi:hypothetical protein